MNIHAFQTVIVGTGAAGYSAAEHLLRLGVTDIALVTDDIRAGTSRNAGSDKQTYYKLTLSGGEPDSVREMAQTLFDGQCMDGDLALCEAALSVPSFLHLAELGVPFPVSRYGEYIGYKTDHDPRRRAASAGPWTSRLMTECLERAVLEKGIPVFSGCQAVRILRDKSRVRGLVCLSADAPEGADRFTVFCCENLILASGGPAAVYADSVYPESQFGAGGIAFEAGARGKNMTEWQYGLASVSPRWNVSGTYMQALPKFISTDAAGGDGREFLFDFFPDPGQLLSFVFLKGYQWPFDVRKAYGGSSLIDILVFLEQRRGRRVFLDFRSNPGNAEEIDYSLLSPEAREYLEKAGAAFGRPIDRLLHMNAPAVDFYREKNVDLAKDRLEIALCAQHCNGGISVNCWWESDVPHLFVIGEAAGTHGVYRPGGSALNAGQVGAARAARFIAAKYTGSSRQDEAFLHLAEDAVSELEALCEKALKGAPSNLREQQQCAAKQMSLCGGPVRDIRGIRETLASVEEKLRTFPDAVSAEKPSELARVFRLRDMLICQAVCLSAMKDYIESGGKSRGGALCTDPEGTKPCAALPDTFAFTLDDGSRAGLVQEISYRNGACAAHWRPVRPIPEEDDFFENVWREFRSHGNVY